MIFKTSFFSSYFFCRYYPSLVELSTAKKTWNKTDKIPTFTGIISHVTILNILEAIRTSQDGMGDGLSGNIVAESRKRGTFGSFCEERMHSVLEVMRNKVESDLKD